MKGYEKYKDSGVEWIGKLPTDWIAIKIKFLNNEDETMFIDGDWIESKVIEDDGIRYLTTGNIGPGYYKEQGKGFISEETFINLNCTEVFPGDLVMSRLNKPIGRACIIPDLGYRIVVAVDNVILRPNSKFDKKFLMYVMNSEGYSTYADLISRGATMQRISRGQLGNVNIPAPSSIEQTQIVKYLDYKTGLIDTIIEKKELLIKKLKEQRQAIINETVIKGVNPIAPMKDSGVVWLGEIPEHWEVEKLKYNADISFSSVDRHQFDEEIKVSICHYPNAYKNEKIELVTFLSEGTCTELEFEKYQLKQGQVIITKDSESANDIGVPCYITETFENGVCGYHLAIITSNEEMLLGEYLFRFLQTQNVRSFFETNSNGVTRFGLGKPTIENLYVPILDLKEQNEIVDYLNSKINIIDNSSEQIIHSIKKLKSYRQSIISEAVTGKVDVRDWQAPKNQMNIKKGWENYGNYMKKIHSRENTISGKELENN